MHLNICQLGLLQHENNKFYEDLLSFLLLRAGQKSNFCQYHTLNSVILS